MSTLSVGTVSATELSVANAASGSYFTTLYAKANTSGTDATNAFAKANAALANTSTTLSGNLAITGTVSSGSNYISPYTGMKNRIINGAMMIDQRNAGASVTPASGDYTVDRWQAIASQASKYSVQQNAGSVTPPSGYKNYLGITSLSSYAVTATDSFHLRQPIEGLNVADLGWGSASAATVTLSFWVRSSLTGTFGGALYNSATNRTYVFSYTINSANTWEQKSVTIAGDTSGTWLTSNGIGIYVQFSLGMGSTYSGAAGSWSSTLYLSVTGAQSVVGTNGATFYITGVQLELGTVATPFESRLYGYELGLCQRYYEKSYDIDTAPGTATFTNLIPLTGYINGWPGGMTTWIPWKVDKRSTPTLTYYDAAGSSSKASWGAIASDTPSTNNITSIGLTPMTKGMRGNGYGVSGTNSTVFFHYVASSEL